MNHSTSILLLIFCFFFASIAQSQTDNNQVSQSQSHFNKVFEFDQETDKKEIHFPVDAGTRLLGFNFDGDINAGHLLITILDPKGKKEGGFTLEAIDKNANKSQNSNTNSNSNSNSNSNTNKDEYSHTYTVVETGKGRATGSMTKTLNNPTSGDWKIVIGAKQLSGKLKVMISQQRKND